jgi:hypothetical protein
MAGTPTRIRHAKVSGLADSGASDKVQPSNWDGEAAHTVELGTGIAPIDDLLPQADKFPYYTGSNDAELAAITALARLIVSKATTAEMLDALQALPLSGGLMTGFIQLAGDPTGALHPATKGYVDALLTGFKPKQSVRAASPIGVNVNIASAPATLDGVTLASGNRIALMDNTLPAQNGIRIFTAAGAALNRATDFDAWVEIPGAQFLVEEGATRADTGWVATVDAGGTLNTTAITFTQYLGGGLYQPADVHLTTLAALTSVANLSALANLTGAADRMAYFTALGAMAIATLTPFGRSINAAADAAAVRTLLGLGTAALLDFGTGAADLVQLDPVTAKLPPVDGSLLTNLPFGTAASNAEARAAASTSKFVTPAAHVASHKPAFKAISSGSQAISANTPTAAIGMSESLDSDGCFDGNRFTPNVAGWYLISGQVNIPTSGGHRAAYIYRNGALSEYYVTTEGGGTATTLLQVSGMIFFNGTTDYVEIVAETDFIGGNLNTASFSGYRLFA